MTGNSIDAASKGFQISDIFRYANRGMLLDIVVFIINLFLMRMLLGRFDAMIKAAAGNDLIAQLSIFVFCIGLFVLLPIGALFKRWHFHYRRKLAGHDFSKDDYFAGGCLFNPIIYLSLNIVLICVIWAFAVQYLYGDQQTSGGPVLILIFGGLPLTIIQTIVVYRYFSPPKKDPLISFLKTPASENIGDIFIFANMICYQLVWNWFMMTPRTRVTGVSDLFFRACFLIAVALFIYFPPRVLYLAEDVNKRRTWITILLANLPVIYRQLIGGGG